ncbi:MAG: M42 family metallopeptidase [Candidatus Latescibacteria bacterium]|nr:M42 family metallopeptidase [Candidatus Latescibacterota bacterium]
MRKKSLAFLKSILKSPSPSGYEQPVQKLWREYVKQFADVRTDFHGSAIGGINPKGSPRIMFAGHCDEIGFMVRYIDDKGFISFGPIGGFDESIIPGRRVTVHTADGPVPGVIGKTPIHLMKPDDRKKASEIRDLWIDIGAKDKKAAKKLVAVGDPVTYVEDFMEMKTGLAVARAFDDRIGSFAVAEVLRLLSEGKKKLTSAVFGVSTVQEEIGLRGARTSAFGVDPQIGIATDVTFATDQPGVEKKQVGDIRLGGGPVIARGPNINPKVHDLLVATAKKMKIPFQVEGISRATGTDANAIQVTRSGVAAGLLSIPVRYMHTPVETLDLTDAENAAKLMAGFAEAVTPDMDFTP